MLAARLLLSDLRISRATGSSALRWMKRPMAIGSRSFLLFSRAASVTFASRKLQFLRNTLARRAG